MKVPVTVGRKPWIKFFEQQANRGNGAFTVVCNQCETAHEVQISAKQVDDWMLRGKHIQDVAPELPPEQRELLISGTCNSCFEKLFPPEEE